MRGVARMGGGPGPTLHGPQLHGPGGYNQGNQGGNAPNGPGYNNQAQGGYNQGGYNQGGYNQGGYNQGGYNQGGPGGYNQGGYNQGGYNQGGYNQGGYNQGGYNQGGYNQGGYNQGGFSQGGYGSPSRCYTVNARINQSPEQGRDDYRIQVEARHNGDHSSDQQYLTIVFNQAVNFVSCSNGTAQNGSGTSITVRLGYHQNKNDNIAMGDFIVKGPKQGLQIVNAYINDGY